MKQQLRLMKVKTLRCPRKATVQRSNSFLRAVSHFFSVLLLNVCVRTPETEEQNTDATNDFYKICICKKKQKQKKKVKFAKWSLCFLQYNTVKFTKTRRCRNARWNLTFDTKWASTQGGTSMSVTNDPSGTLLLAPVTGFMEQAAGWSVVVQRHHTFTEILQGFISFFSKKQDDSQNRTIFKNVWQRCR